MKLEKISKLERNADELWVNSPILHFDADNQKFKSLVKSNLEGNTKYQYIVSNTEVVRTTNSKYKNLNYKILKY